jgi:hypothetical protein
MNYFLETGKVSNSLAFIIDGVTRVSYYNKGGRNNKIFHRRK